MDKERILEALEVIRREVEDLQEDVECLEESDEVIRGDKVLITEGEHRGKVFTVDTSTYSGNIDVRELEEDPLEYHFINSEYELLSEPTWDNISEGTLIVITDALRDQTGKPYEDGDFLVISDIVEIFGRKDSVICGEYGIIELDEFHIPNRAIIKYEMRLLF